MNKVLDNLAFYSGCRFRKFNRGVAMYPNVEADIEKFALAIIKECIAVLDEDDGATHHTELLETHFGVNK